MNFGVYDIVPVKMERCVVKLNDKDKTKKKERWQKISEVAAKQSGRNIIPEIKDVETIKEICQKFDKYDKIIVAYEKEKENSLKNELKDLKENGKEELKIGVLIGPEGGISQEEIEVLKENNAKIVTLGKRILRTETVALSVLSNIMYELEN